MTITKTKTPKLVEVVFPFDGIEGKDVQAKLVELGITVSKVEVGEYEPNVTFVGFKHQIRKFMKHFFGYDKEVNRILANC